MTTLQLTELFESQREIKNLMGKYVSSQLLNREGSIYDMFWSSREDVCLGFNNGYYKGAEAVKEYFRAVSDATMVKSKTLQKIFPDELGKLSDEELYGVGPFKARPLTSPYIQVAEDGETAKGIWMSAGYVIEIEPAGPVGHWNWGTFAGDFVLENGRWKLWHLLYTVDINNIGGQDWAKPAEPYPELPEFEEIKSIKIPEPNVPCAVRELYSADRPFTPLPEVPQPYKTFADTFSYGI